MPAPADGALDWPPPAEVAETVRKAEQPQSTGPLAAVPPAASGHQVEAAPQVAPGPPLKAAPQVAPGPQPEAALGVAPGPQVPSAPQVAPGPQVEAALGVAPGPQVQSAPQVEAAPGVAPGPPVETTARAEPVPQGPAGSATAVELGDDAGADPNAWPVAEPERSAHPAVVAARTAKTDPCPDIARVMVVPPTGFTRLVVRTFDVVVATVALIILSPVMMAVALAVMMESPGPLIYGSPRVGHRKNMFKAWKFRSMHHDADERLIEILRNDPKAKAEYRKFHKLRNDPRLTAVGAMIRRTSLDELPQLFNILRGEMSVVGPRPNLLSERAMFGHHLPEVLLVKPGLTGLWQVSGRNRLPAIDRVRLDVEYVRTRSLRGDLEICLKTLCQMWQPGKHGAY